MDRLTDRWRQAGVRVCTDLAAKPPTDSNRSLASNAARFPHPGTVIASSRTSPLDALYLAAIFDPIFTISYPTTRPVQPVSLFGALINAFAEPRLLPPVNAELVDIPDLIAANPRRVIVVFPECTTTNGRGILKFAPSLLTAAPKTKIFPISLRYTAADITTPVPGSYLLFLWNLLSKPTHCIRVRIAEYVHNDGAANGTELWPGKSHLGSVAGSASDEDSLDDSGGEGLTPSDRRLLERTGESLARLGRVKRVGLGVKEKMEFVKAWTRQKR